jgi:beta-glucosidase
MRSSQVSFRSWKEAVWTPTSAAPAGLLTPLEGDRHDRFINQARAGNIDIVFFGSTETEMWLWQDRGRKVWDQKFASRKAANFGSQGTRFDSLMWRFQNGELDGYQAKVIVLQAQIGVDDYATKYAAIIKEIRAHQPQAKILLFGVFPRFQTHTEPAQANAVLSTLKDDQTVFFIDMSDRFFRPDRSYNTAMWSSGGPEVGIQPRTYEVWADVLQPWLDRFAR